MMGSRSGDIDASAVTYIMEKLGKKPQEMADYLNKESGVLGISGISSDMRDVENAAKEGNEKAILALKMYNYRIKKYIGAYAAAMGVSMLLSSRLVLVKTRLACVKRPVPVWNSFGIKIDKEKNNIRGKEAEISTDDSRVKVWVVPTDEEIVIARDTMALVQGK